MNRFPFVRGAIAIPIGGMLANDAITADGRQNRACGVSAVCTIERHNETSLHSMSRHSCAHRNTLFGSSMFQYVAVSHSTMLTPSDGVLQWTTDEVNGRSAAAERPFTSSVVHWRSRFGSWKQPKLGKYLPTSILFQSLAVRLFTPPCTPSAIVIQTGKLVETTRD